MSGSSSKSDSGSDSRSNFDQEVWSGQAPYLEQMYNQAGSLFGQTNNAMQSQIPVTADQMGNVADQANPAWQQQLQGGAFGNMDLQNSLMGSLNQSLNNPTAMQDINNMIMGGSGNNYADAMRNQYMTDAGNAQNLMMSNMDARAVGAGQSGSSRHGILQAQGMQDINSNLQSNLANLGYDTFDADLDRKLQIAQQADQGTLERQNMMSNMIGQQDMAQQGAITGGTQMQNLGMGSFAPYMMPWDAASAYSNMIGNPTILGSGTMYGSSDSSGKSLSGGMFGG